MTNTVPGVRARDIPSPFPRTMTDRTTIGELLSSARAADVLLYVHEHPCCRRSDVYREVSRGSSAKRTIEKLLSDGLICSDDTPFLTLTHKGESLYDVLLSLSLVLDVNCLRRFSYQAADHTGDSDVVRVPYSHFIISRSSWASSLILRLNLDTWFFK